MRFSLQNVAKECGWSGSGGGGSRGGALLTNILTQQQRYKKQNAALSSAREAIEHQFAGLKINWKILQRANKFKMLQKRNDGRWAAQYAVPFFLQNCKVCLEGNQVSEFFDMTGEVTLSTFLELLEQLNE